MNMPSSISLFFQILNVVKYIFIVRILHIG